MRIILAVIVVVVSWLAPARAEEPRTFYGKTVEGWIAVLRDKKSTLNERRKAAEALAAFGPEAKAAAPDLIALLPEKELKDAAIGALSRIGCGAEHTVPILIEQFINEGCAHLTGQAIFGYHAFVEDNLVRFGGAAVPALINLLNGPNREMRLSAADVLARIGPAARAAVPSLIRAIDHPEPTDVAETLKIRSVRALGRIGPDAAAAIPSLNRLFGEDGVDQCEIVVALNGIGAPPVWKLVDAFLLDADFRAAHDLAWLGPKAHEAIPALKKALADKRPQVRFSSAAALAFIEPAATESIPVLVDALNHLDDRELEVSDAPAALARFGPKARAAVPKLAELVRKGSTDPGLVEALVQIDPDGKESVPALISALDDDDSGVVTIAAIGLGLLGPRAKVALPALARVVTREFKEKDLDAADPQASAVDALRRIGPAAKPAIPILIGALKYRRGVPEDKPDDELGCPDYSLAAAAAQALGSFRAEAKAAVPALIEAVRKREKEDASWSVRQQAILALGQIGPDASAAVPVLRNLLKEQEKFGGYVPEILVALSQLDPRGKELAETWLANRTETDRAPPWMRVGLAGRAMVLGAMGRASFETDWLTRVYLERLDAELAPADREDGGPCSVTQELPDVFGLFGPAARVAIPRLEELRTHSNPSVRLWAAEALDKVVAPARRADLRLDQSR